MYLKKAACYHVNTGDFSNLAELLGNIPFAPTLPTQMQSRGFAPVLQGVTDDLVLTIGSFELARFVVETRKVPASALRDETEKRVKTKEAENGQPLTREEKASIKDAVHIEMLQGIPPTRTSFFVAFGQGLLLPFTTSTSHIDGIISDLREKMEGGLRVIPCLSGIEPLLTAWLVAGGESLPTGFSLGDSAKFSGRDGDRASLSNVTLPCPESTALLNMPSTVTHLSLATELLTFTLNDKGLLTAFKPTDLLDTEMLDGTENLEDTAHQVSASLTIELNAIHKAITGIEQAIPREPS
jgi:DNA recombination-dependent growth factor C